MYSYYQDLEKKKVEINPKELGIQSDLRAIAIPKKLEGVDKRDILAKHVANLGMDALSGEKGMFYDGLLYSATLILWHLEIEKSIIEASEKVRTVLDSARSIERLKDN